MTSLIYGHSKQNKQCGNSKRNDANFYKISPPSCLFVNFWHMSVVGKTVSCRSALPVNNLYTSIMSPLSVLSYRDVIPNFCSLTR